jgi:hypothetical protein
MLKLRGKCSACGVALELTVTEPFTESKLVVSLCPACTDRQFLTNGGVILELRHELEKARFPLGRMTITGAAVDALAEAGEHAATYLVRHARGDWGEYGHYDDIQLTLNQA